MHFCRRAFTGLSYIVATLRSTAPHWAAGRKNIDATLAAKRWGDERSVASKDAMKNCSTLNNYFI